MGFWLGGDKSDHNVTTLSIVGCLEGSVDIQKKRHKKDAKKKNAQKKDAKKKKQILLPFLCQLIPKQRQSETPHQT